MKRAFSLFVLITNSIVIGLSQPKSEIKEKSGYQISKPIIDSNSYSEWPSVEDALISDDGNYFHYAVSNRPKGSQTLILKATSGNWKLEVPKAYGCKFTRDSRKAVFLKTNDSLCIVSLGRNITANIPNVRSFELSQFGNNEWLAFRTNSTTDVLIINNLVTGERRLFEAVRDYVFSKDGKVLILLTEKKSGGSCMLTLEWIELHNNKSKVIWSSSQGSLNVSNFIFDAPTEQMAFLVEQDIDNRYKKTIWYYKNGDNRATLLVDDKLVDINHRVGIESINPGFTDDGLSILFKVSANELEYEAKNEAVQLNLWSYNDLKLQSLQLQERGMVASSLATVHIKDQRIVRLGYENERCLQIINDFAFFRHADGDIDPTESNWNSQCKNTYYIVSLKNGERKQIKEMRQEVEGYCMSPDGKYVIFYDEDKKQYLSFETASGITRSITENIPVSWLLYYRSDESSAPRGIAGWVAEGKYVLIYDRYDIWKVDPSGVTRPVNVTRGFGNSHNVIFYLGLMEYSKFSYSENERIILNAFEISTKNNGFYSATLSEKGDIKPLTMGPYIYEVKGNPYIPDGSNFTPIKARNSNKFIVRRMSATESANYFLTNNFRTFNRISNLHPEKNYNWLTTELHTWKMSDGNMSQGIMYKPENFDSTKKYPVIFYYYERRSDALNAFLKPEFLTAGCSINIPSFVSKGYIVFSPDIYYSIGNPMQGSYNSVVSAAEYISKFPFIDSKRMGLQGCSFGGIQTNYLVTHTKLFAAACSASGVSDLISHYGALQNDGRSLQSYYDNGQGRMGYAPWQKPDLYIKNSPIFHVDKVTTPLLMMHTSNDGICPFSNAIEFFTALRRLGKTVWLLEYNDGRHGVYGKSAKDFSIRMAQFFDYYLKDDPAPGWMVRGIPAKMKSIDDGLELRKDNKCPQRSLLIGIEGDKDSSQLYF